MSPENLSTLHETCPPVNYFLMDEAKNRSFVAAGAQMVFAQDSVQIYKDPGAFAASSLMLRDCHNDHDIFDSAMNFWENPVPDMDANNAIVHLVGSKVPHASAEYLECAEDTISIMDHYAIGVADLTMIACTSKATKQMLDYFKPISFAVERGDFENDGKIVEKIIIDQISKDLTEIRIAAEEYPRKIVEAYLKCFKTSNYGLQRLQISFPETKLPLDPFIGMKCHLLNSFQNNFALLIRSSSTASRNVLLRGEREDGYFQLDFTRITDGNDLLLKMFGIFYEECIDMPYLGISHYTPSELRELLESDW